MANGSGAFGERVSARREEARPGARCWGSRVGMGGGGTLSCGALQSLEV